jgi:hypothetical protein
MANDKPLPTVRRMKMFNKLKPFLDRALAIATTWPLKL